MLHAGNGLSAPAVDALGSGVAHIPVRETENVQGASNSAMQRQILNARLKRARREVQVFQPPHLAQPLIIVSAPRAGSTLLLETLARFPDLWTIGEESHEIVEGIPALHPAAHGYASNCLTAADLTPPIAELLCDRLARQLRDRSGRLWMELAAEERPDAPRLLEKTPKNALRIPFLRALFPDARFLFLHRAPAENIASILDGWHSRRFVAYHALPGWPRGAWSFLLTPGWEQWAGRPLVEVAAQQWRVANETILAELATCPCAQWLAVSYAELVTAPRQSVQRIADFAGLTWDETVEQALAAPLPLSRMTFSAPSPDKWRKYAAEIETVIPDLESLAKRLAGLESDSE